LLRADNYKERALWSRQLEGGLAASTGDDSPLHAGCHDSPENDRGGRLPGYILKLYVTGSSSRAGVAIANLQRICEEELAGQYQLEIIDVLQNPQLAEDEKILATPTLIKQLPPPLRRVIGDLSDKDKVLLGLEVQPKSTEPPPDEPR
jgi:circadian clock protein KaiB